MFFGPVSDAASTNGASGGTSLWGFVPFAGGVCFVGFVYFRRRQGGRSLKTLAKEHGWTCNGEKLPSGLDLRTLCNTSRSIRISNAIDGSQRGIDFVAFDCIIGEGRTRSEFSAVAARSQDNPFGAERFDPSLGVSRINDWFLLRREMHGIEVHSPGYFLMSATEMISVIESIG
jgi:hypothetical protein